MSNPDFEVNSHAICGVAAGLFAAGAGALVMGALDARARLREEASHADDVAALRDVIDEWQTYADSQAAVIDAQAAEIESLQQRLATIGALIVNTMRKLDEGQL
jgi:hypothetical protein